ncbi:hypothetical protein IDJ77_27385 [Mucilaginibacter sp. ZT4R22]|uniref:Uncharacterized protein n=1 Tax=Mucilaginibacter pankratovii TaxID=2772110 RepID=A0ABR7X212_9SPHI|nr:hypothetical protein [Mucilaginibacter pankratovii]MBD1367562.1 hypothetical protein [Mucilaginibacter pankratovii]
MKLHQVYKTLKCKLIHDSVTSRKRFVPLEGQGLPTNIFIEGDRAIRELYAVNTIFIASDVKVCKKTGNDTFYLRAKNQSLTPLSSLKLDGNKSL